MLKKFICCLVGHNFIFGKFPEMWCSCCGKDFSEEVKKEIKLIEKESEERYKFLDFNIKI